METIKPFILPVVLMLPFIATLFVTIFWSLGLWGVFAFLTVMAFIVMYLKGAFMIARNMADKRTN